MNHASRSLLLNNWSFGKKRPPLLSRLSNIIIVQVLFVFAAVVMILFFPQRESQVDFSGIENRISAVTEKIAEYLSKLPKGGDGTYSVADSILTDLIRGEKSIVHASVYLWTDDARMQRISSFGIDEAEPKDDLILSEKFGGSESIQKALAPKGAKGQFVPLRLTNDHLTCAYSFEIAGNRPALIVATLEHEVVVSNRNGLLYGLFLLFLGSILVSLLTVHLLARRFRDPLKRLEQGLTKTASGELFYLLEENDDAELCDLVRSFNRMSKTLWSNQQAHKHFNRLLKDAYIAQAESQVFLATLIDCSPCCVVAASSDGEIVIFNRKAAEVFGYDNEEALGLTIDRLFGTARDGDRSEVDDNSHEKSGEVVCRRRDGSTFPAYLVSSRVAAKPDQPPVHLFIFLDISESKNFQEMMVSIDRYYTRGEMAGDIAHEINNYLAVLGGNIELMPLFLKKGDHEKINKKLELMKNTVDKIARFSDGLMDTNYGDVNYVQADLNQLAQNILAFLKPQNRFDNVTMNTDLSPDIPLVEMDPNQIQQTLVNLIQNGADATVNNETERLVELRTELSEDGRYVRVVVADNGTGVDPESRDILFEKRFTTKRKGHGYGLITCKRIIDSHRGKIGYRRTSDRTEFFFEIPIRHESPEEKLTEQSDEPEAKASTTV